MITEFLLRQRGYKSYTIRSKSGRFYLGSWERRIQDQHGIRYFVNIDLWQFPDQPVSANARSQLHLDDGFQEVFDISRFVETIEQAEVFMAKAWDRMDCGYYKRTDEGDAARHPQEIEEHEPTA